MSDSENKLAFSTKLFQRIKHLSFLMKLRLCFYFFDSLILAFLKKPKKQPDGKKRIGILALTGMGDCIIFCRLADSMKKAFPADQYELEEQIITDLYGYKDKETGKRVISIALRNKDAVLLGYGGPECGEICYWIAEGYNWDHCDSLSTNYGAQDTSVSPIFIAAGPGIKKGFYTDRIIRQVDFAATVAVVGGVRMPAQCEGAPVYQILDWGE